MTVADITRQAISEHLGGDSRRLGAAAAGRSGHTDISVRIEEILREEMSS